MADNWTTTTLTASNFKNAWNRPEEQRTISTIQGFLDGSVDPEAAAHNIASTYHPRLLKGEKISYYPFTLLSLAIIHPTTTFKNFEDVVQMLMHMSKLPDVIVDGQPFKENGRTYWHDIPEFSFWFLETALTLHSAEEIDQGLTRTTWLEQQRRYEAANTFAALYLCALDPSRSPIEFNGMRRIAQQVLCRSLEVEISSPAQVRRATIYIPAAAQWIILAGPQIWQFCRNKENHDGQTVWLEWLGGSDGSKPLWTGDDGFGIERWMLWKKRFQDIAGLQDGSEGVHRVVSSAREAAGVMDAIDKAERTSYV